MGVGGGLGLGGGSSKPKKDSKASSKGKASSSSSSKGGSGGTKKGGSGGEKKAGSKGKKDEEEEEGSSSSEASSSASSGAAAAASKKKKKGGDVEQAGGHADAFEANDDGTLAKKCNAAEWTFYKNLNKHKAFKKFVPRFVRVEGKADADPKVVLGDLTAGLESPCIMDIKIGTTSAAPDADDEKRAAMEAKDKSTTTTSLGIRVVGMRVYNHVDKKWIKHDKPWGKALTDDSIAAGIAEYFDTGSPRDWRQEVVQPFVDQILELQKHMRKQTDLMFISSSLLFVYDAKGADPKPTVKMIDFAHVFPLEDGAKDEGYLKGLQSLLPILEGLVAGNDPKKPSKGKGGAGKEEVDSDDDSEDADAKAAAEGVAAMQLTDEQILAEWKTADKDGDGTLTLKEITRLLGKLNVKKSAKVVKAVFNDVDADDSGELDFEEFKVFLNRIRVRPEVEDIFAAATTGGKSYLTAKEFSAWLKKTQGENVKEKRCQELISKYEAKGAGNLYVTGFAAYLLSGMASGMSAAHREVTEDMSQPMSHYFIASSHNTYLLGDQLKGESSVQAYINTFEKSCRCVELDCWDNPKDKSMPIIFHGHTLTSKITFEDVIKTIRDHGFKHSEYPIILSLEVHCDEEGQRAMAKIITDILGAADMLPPQFEAEGKMPPPGELKRKVLLKGKMVPFDDADDEDDEDKAEYAAAVKAAQEGDAGASSSSKKGKKGKGGKAEAEDAEDAAAASKKKKKAAIAQELSDLVHLKAVHFKDWEDSKENGKAWEMSSFAEGRMVKYCDKEAAAFCDYNTRQLSRIYPKGMRINSSNYDPVPAWNAGSQIVALNYQTGEDPLWVNDGKFLGNGCSGYILKPEFMRGTSSDFDHNVKSAVQKTLVVRLVSGWQFPKSTNAEKDTGEIIDPYVSLAMHGVKADKNRFQSKTISNNGFNPIWEHLSTSTKKAPKKPKNVFRFPLTQPELAVLLFKVYDYDLGSANDFIAQYAAAPVHLGLGYRSLPLKNPDGKPYGNGSSLLVHISWE